MYTSLPENQQQKDDSVWSCKIRVHRLSPREIVVTCTVRCRQWMC